MCVTVFVASEDRKSEWVLVCIQTSGGMREQC